MKQIILPYDIEKQMNWHASNAYPREACGMLIGTKEGVVISAQPTENIHKDKHRAFAVPFLSILLSRKTTSLFKGIRVIGFYHTHPNARALPSDMDMADAWPGHVYLIARVQCGDVRPWRAWLLDNRKPVELPINQVASPGAA